MKKKILVVDDEKSIRKTLKVALEDKGYLVDAASNGEEALDLIKRENHDVIILDLKLDGEEGIELYHEIKREGFNPIVIVITGYGSIESAVEAMRSGAYNYITKPLNFDIIEMTISEAIEKQELIKENISLKDQLSSKSSFKGIIGKSKPMQKVFELTKQAARSQSNVLIVGETGTGKELIADAIHFNSPRGSHSWVKLNCAALPDNLLESELFGYEKGAFTDAKSTKKGMFELAHKGDILFDELGCMSIKTQAKILRVFEDKMVMRLGGQKPIDVDVRIISSTNKNLESAVEDGTFRKELYYRVNVIRIEIPPLRDRREDIPLLADCFIKKYNSLTRREVKTISPSALGIMMNYDWPGNVRELENVIERAFVLDLKDNIFPKHLPVELKAQSDESPPEGKTLEDITFDAIVRTLEKAQGNQTHAAKILGVSREFIRRKLKGV